MVDSYKLIRVFLASPEDVAEERGTVSNVISEINANIANRNGYHFELLRWENAVRGPGRAQDRLNKQVDLCEVFIGMLWKKLVVKAGHRGAT